MLDNVLLLVGRAEIAHTASNWLCFLTLFPHPPGLIQARNMVWVSLEVPESYRLSLPALAGWAATACEARCDRFASCKGFNDSPVYKQGTFSASVTRVERNTSTSNN